MHKWKRATKINGEIRSKGTKWAKNLWNFCRPFYPSQKYAEGVEEGCVESCFHFFCDLLLMNFSICVFQPYKKILKVIKYLIYHVKILPPPSHYRTLNIQADTQSLTKPLEDTNPSQCSALSFALRLEATLSSGLPLKVCQTKNCPISPI